MKKILFTAVGLSVVAAIAVWGFVVSAPEPSKAGEEPGRELAEVERLRRDVASLKRNVAVLDVATRRALAQQAVEPEKVRGSSAALTEDDVDSDVEVEPHRRDPILELDGRLNNERVDAEWSRMATRQIEGTFASGKVPGTHLVDVRCATSVCRVVLEHDAKDAQFGLARAVARLEPFSAGVYYDYEEEPLRTNAFVVRDQGPRPVDDAE